MDDQAIYDMLVELQDAFRGPVIDTLDDAVAKAKCAVAGGPELGHMFGGAPVIVEGDVIRLLFAAHRAHSEALERLVGMIAVVRLRLDSEARMKGATPS